MLLPLFCAPSCLRSCGCREGPGVFGPSSFKLQAMLVVDTFVLAFANKCIQNRCHFGGRHIVSRKPVWRGIMDAIILGVSLNN